jgi:hypothetical protein
MPGLRAPGVSSISFFTGLLVAQKGKIKLLRESINTVANAQALNPNGAADPPPPVGEIFSVPPNYVS